MLVVHNQDKITKYKEDDLAKPKCGDLVGATFPRSYCNASFCSNNVSLTVSQEVEANSLYYSAADELHHHNCYYCYYY